MSVDLFHKIIDEIATWNRHVTIGVSVYGEPFLNPDWLHLFQYIRDKAPLSGVTIVTNGSTMDDEKIDELLKFRNIEAFGFSLYAYHPDTYCRLMGLPVDTISKIYHAIERISKERPDINILISYTLDPNFMSMQEQKLFIEKWGKYASYPHPMVYNHQHSNYMRNNMTNVPCQTMFNNLSILYDGRVSLCCFDARGEVILGDVNTQTLLEVWHGDMYKKCRDLHVSGMRDSISLCNRCTYGLSAISNGVEIGRE